MSTGRYPKLTLEQYKQALECRRIHERTPTLSQLEKKWGMSINTLSHMLRRGVKRYDYIIMKERAEKMKENAIQRPEDKESKAQRVLTKVVRQEQSTNNQARKGTKKEYRAKWQEYKSSKSCTKCGVSHPAVLDFHHVIRFEKRSIPQLINRRQYSLAIREAEEKCIPLCANCHRMLHWKENRRRWK